MKAYASYNSEIDVWSLWKTKSDAKKYKENAQRTRGLCGEVWGFERWKGVNGKKVYELNMEVCKED